MGNVSIGQLFAAAVIPGLLMTVFLMAAALVSAIGMLVSIATDPSLPMLLLVVLLIYIPSSTLCLPRLLFQAGSRRGRCAGRELSPVALIELSGYCPATCQRTPRRGR